MRGLHLLISLPVRREQLLDLARSAAPHLVTMIRRGDPLAAAPGLAAVVCECLGIARQRDWPVAPLTARADGLDASGGYWLRADPVHLEAGMGGLMLRPPGELEINGAEAAALAAAINEAWRARGTDGLELLAPRPGRWYLRLPSPPDLETTSPDLLVGEYLTPHLPRGVAAAALAREVNEAQMVLHDHPVNQAREARGLLAVNGLWLWGGGVSPRVSPGIGLLASALDDDGAALARAAGVAHIAAPARQGDFAAAGETLAILAPGRDDHDLRDYLAGLERDWLAPLFRNLVLGRLRRLHMHLLTRPASSHVLHTAQAWRFWR